MLTPEAEAVGFIARASCPVDRCRPIRSQRR